MKNRKKITSIIVLILGVAALITGIVMLVTKLTSSVAINDAEYLVQIGEWVEDGEPGVVWNFTEIGKGTLTTNNHANDYDFDWAIVDGKLQIKTAWLYELNDEFEYELDQGASKLELGENLVFLPL